MNWRNYFVMMTSGLALLACDGPGAALANEGASGDVVSGRTVLYLTADYAPFTGVESGNACDACDACNACDGGGNSDAEFSGVVLDVNQTDVIFEGNDCPNGNYCRGVAWSSDAPIPQCPAGFSMVGLNGSAVVCVSN